MESALGITLSQWSVNGYTCPKCGAWVNGDVTHVCGGGIVDYWISPPIQDQILAQLTRIAQALETIAGKM